VPALTTCLSASLVRLGWGPLPLMTLFISLRAIDVAVLKLAAPGHSPAKYHPTQ
jgi:hypothetical protein